MYTPSSNFSEEQEIEIVCLMTGESYIHLSGDEKTVMDPKLAQGSVDCLPPRFYKTPFIRRYPDGQVRVFGSLD
jgi:hypothetical protein